MLAAGALVAAGCSLDPTESLASRFSVSWELADGTGRASSCAEAGAARVEIRSELLEASAAADAGPGAPDAAPVELTDTASCDAGGGTTAPLPAGSYRVRLRAVDEAGEIVGTSPAVDAVVGPRQTVELERFAISAPTP